MLLRRFSRTVNVPAVDADPAGPACAANAKQGQDWYDLAAVGGDHVCDLG
jgi:hypothetical protein